MTWPWVQRNLLDEVSAKLVANETELSDVKHQRDAARAAGEDCAHRLSACDLERLEIKKNFATLAALSRQLEEKLKDCTDPPITRKELQKLTKLVASLRAERDGLQGKLEKAEDTLKRNEQRMIEAEERAG
jgi:flagellar biosynthesis chaperone FliJ